MGLTEFFICPRGGSEAAMSAIDGAEAGAARDRFGLLETGDLDVIVLDHLARAVGVAGSVWVEVPTNTFDSMDGEDVPESFVVEVDERFVDVLAALSANELRVVGERWIATWMEDLAGVPAFGGVVPEWSRPELDGPHGWWPVLEHLAALARRATDARWALMLRMFP